MGTFMGKFLALLLGVCVLAFSFAGPSDTFECSFGPSSTKLIPNPFPDPFVFEESGSFYATSTSNDATRLVMKKLSLTDVPCGAAAPVATVHDVRLSYEKLAGVDPEFFPKHKSMPLNTVDRWGLWSPSIQRNRAGRLRLYATVHFGYFNTAVAVFHPAAGQTWSEDDPIRHWIFEKFVAGGGAGGLKHFAAYDFKSKIHDGKRYALYNYNPFKGASGARQSIFIQEIDEQDTLLQSNRAMYEFKADPGSEVAWGSLPLVEGGSIHVHKGRFFLFYTTGTYLYDDYRIGVALSSESILGPYHKMMQNGSLAYVLQSRNAARSGYVGEFYNAPGIPNVIAGEDGALKLVFHANDATETPSQESCGKGINGICFNSRQRFTHLLDLDLGEVVFDQGAYRPSGVSVQMP